MITIDTPHEYVPVDEYDVDCALCGEPESLHEWEAETAQERAERLCVYGIVLMIVVKGVGVSLLGLDADAWYVWPWTWVAFGLMAPAVIGWVVDAKERF